MGKLELKIKISVLWMANTVIDLVQIVLSLFDPAFRENPARGEVFPVPIGIGLIVAFTFSLVVPVAMAFLVFVIGNPKANKWANVIVGVIIALMSWADFLMKLPGMTGAFIASGLVTNLAPTVLIPYAWQLDRPENRTPGSDS
jgi:hypothetical protein